MSQMGMSGDHVTGDSKVSNTSRAVLLLALFVVLFTVLLHELDDSSTKTNLARESSATSSGDEKNAAAVPTTVTTLPARTPAEVKVLVANGVGINGVASKVAARLQPSGYQLAKPGNTTATQTNSAVQYAPGFQAEAEGVATSLGLTAAAVQPIPTPSLVTDLQASNVVVIVGNDLAAASGASTTTTSPANVLNGPLGTTAGTPTTTVATTTTTLLPTN